MLPQHAQPCPLGLARAGGVMPGATKSAPAEAPSFMARTSRKLQLTCPSTTGTAAQLGLSAAMTVLSAESALRSLLLRSAAPELQLGLPGSASMVPLLSSARCLRQLQDSGVSCSPHRFLDLRALRSRCSCATLRLAAKPRTAAWITTAAAERRACCRRARMRRQALAMQPAPQSKTHLIEDRMQRMHRQMPCAWHAEAGHQCRVLRA